jgi:hypothetical protein
VHRQVADSGKSRTVDGDAGSILLKLEDDGLAPENEQVRVLGDDAVDIAFTLEVTELRVGFVWRNDIFDAFGLESLPVSYDGMLKAYLDELVSHLGGDIDAFSVAITGFLPPPLRVKCLGTRKIIGARSVDSQ